MKKQHLVLILFFGGLWGAAEAVLGDALYSAGAPYAAVYLTVIGFFLLAVSRAFVPWTGAPTIIAVCAMLYKVLNVPFFACHLTAIALLGLSFDIMWGAGRAAGVVSGPARPSHRSLFSLALQGAAACYLGHVLFVLAMVYGFASEHWIARGLSGALRHIGVTGTLAAAGCAIVTPLGARLGIRLAGRASAPALSVVAFRATGIAVFVVTVGLWVYGAWGKVVRG